MPKGQYERKSQDEQTASIQHKMDPAERESLERRVAEREHELRPSESQGMSTDPTKLADKGRLRDQIEKDKRLLQHDEELGARGSEKDRLNRRRLEIEGQIIDKMPTKREMWCKDPNDHQRAVRHNLTFQEKFDPLVHEWQDIKRRLEPEDPAAHSLENIRPD